MKVAFLTYPAAFQNVGGGEILLLKVQEYLKREGVQADLFDAWKARLEDYDVLQVFGSVKDCLGLVRVANSRKVKVAITPLLWSDLRHALRSSGSLKDRAGLALRYLTKVVLPSFPSARRELLMRSDVVFPNSEIEKRQIHRLFSIPESKMTVVHNGVDREFAKADPGAFQTRHGRDRFVLGVGRIEPRKNQLNLIRAVKKAGGIRLVLIGSPVSGYERYYLNCQKEGEGFVTFLPTLPHNDPMLKSAYSACSLFVLQGWFETPGLVAMEAALAGARVIATEGGSTREYFRDFVDYFDPANVTEMASRIQKNLSKTKDGLFSQHVLENFTWEKIARSYRDAYQRSLSAS